MATPIATAASLPNGRVYELVTPDLNHASINPPAGQASASGDRLAYNTVDAPDNAQSAMALNNVVATRGASSWSSVSLSPPLVHPTSSYFSFYPLTFSSDFTQSVDSSDQPLAGGTPPPGQNVYLRRADGSHVLLTSVGTPIIPGLNIYPSPAFDWATPDFSHLFLRPNSPQSVDDPTSGNNAYEWSDGVLRMVGILPGEVVSPDGAVVDVSPGPTGPLRPVLPPVSDDGHQVLFNEGGGTNGSPLYLRKNHTSTVDVSASQRTVLDPNSTPLPHAVGINAAGTKVLFLSSSALTNDATTGQSGGVPIDGGNDLYSYDVPSGVLSDLTVDHEPADLATGAGVQLVMGASRDARYVYFEAVGKLAPGGTSGRNNLYVWHDGVISFISNATGIDGSRGFYLSSDGVHAAFASTDSLTGYDNTDASGSPTYQVFVATVGGSLACASCRPDGSKPTSGAQLPDANSGESTTTSSRANRAVTDGGHRVYFETADAVLPGTGNGQSKVFQWEDGKVSAISPGDSETDAHFLDASDSGDDVFFFTHDDLLNGTGSSSSAIYDARVNGGFPVTVRQECSGVACQGAGTAAPALPVVATVDFLGDGNVQDTSTTPSTSTKVTVSKLTAIKGSSGALKVKVPAKGRLTVSGSGIQTKRTSPSKAQTVTVKLSLTSTASKTLRSKRSFKTKVKVAFADAGGHTSTATLSITFKAASKGR